jgi:hypothetical protein
MHKGQTATFTEELLRRRYANRRGGLVAAG